ncbi:MAG: diguanylate cyclase [Kiritimatiellales bacterium]|nr:diguanylate cyclase [Kiritimatiellales bacterium]
MLSPIQQLTWIAQLPLAQAGQLLLVTGISFAILTLISSTYRFHRMIQMEESELQTVDDCNDFFFIQVTRYLSKINRTSSGFSILILQFVTEEPNLRAVQEKLLAEIKNIIREASDKACLLRDDCVAAIIDTEGETMPAIASRITAEMKAALSRSGATSIRAGVSSFPAHGLNTQSVIDAANEALDSAGFENPLPFCIAPLPKTEEPPPETPEELGELSKQDKNAALDPLTGVLRPGVIGSYIRKYLAEIRHKKQPATLLCVGINRIDQIIQLHGEPAADDVIAGVSKILQNLTRNCDLIGRYHRDDFMILAPGTLQQGELIATRLREAVQKELFVSNGKRIKSSVSVGIAAYPEHGRNLRDLFRGAYRALEILRGWNTTACLVYDPAQHAKKAEHETRR